MAEDNKTSVTLTDGRVVGFTPKQKVLRNYTVDEATGVIVVTLDFRNGETRSFEVPGSLILKFAAHGAVQKLGDAVTSEENEDDAIAALDDLMGRLAKGEWTAARAKGEFAGVSTLIRALVEVTGKPVEAIKAYLENKSAKEKTALRKSDRLAPVIAKLEAGKPKKAADVIDTDSLFAELGAAEGTPSPKASKGS